jgi:predicted RNA-binding Zn-ribbon protein involved in translation (DUF1610 family)
MRAEALFAGGNFDGKQVTQHFASQHDQAWHNARIALISTVLWVPVGVGMIAVSHPSTQCSHSRIWRSQICRVLLSVITCP